MKRATIILVLMAAMVGGVLIIVAAAKDSTVVGTQSVTNDDLIAIAAAGKQKWIPTTNWTTATTGTGSTSQSLTDMVSLQTGTYVNSNASAYTPLRGVANAYGYNILDWNQRVTLVADIGRTGADSQSVTRIQLTSGTAVGDLAAPGIGIKIVNGVCYGESFGTSQATVDLGYSIPSTQVHRFAVKHMPDLGKIEFYVDGALSATQSTAASVPTNTTSSVPRIIFSTATGTVGITTAAYSPTVMLY